MDGAEEAYGKLTVTLKRLSGYGDITERRLEVAESEGTSPHRKKMTCNNNIMFNE